jgi:hypothetical protein
MDSFAFGSNHPNRRGLNSQKRYPARLTINVLNVNQYLCFSDNFDETATVMQAGALKYVPGSAAAAMQVVARFQEVFVSDKRAVMVKRVPTESSRMAGIAFPPATRRKAMDREA